MSIKYYNPPIVEALCEFQFVPSQPWDLTVMGLFYGTIKDKFPVKQQQVNIRLGPQTTAQAKQGPIPFELSQRMQFFRADKTALIQVSPDILTVNQLRPYTAWREFKQLILANFDKYVKLTGPKGFRRIGLRYINRIEFDTFQIKLNDYFNYYPTIPADLPQMHGAFNTNVEISYDGEGEELRLTLTSVAPEKAHTFPLILDLDYYTTKSDGVSIAEVPGWIEVAHERIEGAFERSITDKCRVLFSVEERNNGSG